MFGILSSFYNYLMQEEITQINPIALIRQKSKFLQKQQKVQVVRRLSNNEWKAVIDHIKSKSEENPSHERTLFMLSCLYAMYLRISELTSTKRHSRWPACWCAGLRAGLPPARARWRCCGLRPARLPDELYHLAVPAPGADHDYARLWPTAARSRQQRDCRNGRKESRALRHGFDIDRRGVH